MPTFKFCRSFSVNYSTSERHDSIIIIQSPLFSLGGKVFILSTVLKFYLIKISGAEQCGEITSLLYCWQSRQKVFTHSHQQGSRAEPHGKRKRKTGPSNTKLVIKISHQKTIKQTRNILLSLSQQAY